MRTRKFDFSIHIVSCDWASVESRCFLFSGFDVENEINVILAMQNGFGYVSF